MKSEPKVVDVELVNEPPPNRRSSMDRPAQTGGRGEGGPPIHPLAALLLVVVDNLWLVPEFLVIDWVVTVPLCFVTVLIPALLIQKLLKKQRVGPAVGYALLLAVIAAVPTSLLGTPVGAALLAWFGISKLWSGGQSRVHS